MLIKYPAKNGGVVCFPCGAKSQRWSPLLEEKLEFSVSDGGASPLPPDGGAAGQAVSKHLVSKEALIYSTENKSVLP